tara:strand:- start:1090 stop:1407 length:318 start_codon:yes stop_codon:yes gene_type:complete
MKITKTQLRQVIKEEMNKVLLENLISEMDLAQLQAEKEAAAASLKKVKQAGTVITQIRDAMMPLDDGMKLSILRQVQKINQEYIGDPDARLVALNDILSKLKSKQ